MDDVRGGAKDGVMFGGIGAAKDNVMNGCGSGCCRAKRMQRLVVSDGCMFAEREVLLLHVVVLWSVFEPVLTKS